MNILGLMPESISVKVGNNMYDVYISDGKYILDTVLTEHLETDYVYIYVNDVLFDTIEKRIALRSGDTLHLEYSIYVGE